jgi:hypothetical protein
MPCLQQGTGDSAGPEIDVAAALLADRPLDRDVGDLQPAARPQHAEDLRERDVLVRQQIEDAVRDRDVEARLGKRERLGDASTNIAFARRASPAARRAASTIAAV